MRAREPTGFVLPLTLVALAVIGLALWAALAVLESMSRDLQLLEDDLRLATIGSEIEGQVTYLLLSEPFRPGGIEINGRRVSMMESFGLAPAEEMDVDPRDEPIVETLLLDGTPYRYVTAGPADRQYVIRLQDDAGLFNFRLSSEQLVARYLEGLGVDEEQARKMAGALADYMDPDDLTRLNGAEKDEYLRLGRPPPTNRPIDEPSELAHVLFWDEVMKSRTGVTIAANMSAGLDGDMRNVNAASRQVLAAWYGLDDTAVDQVLKARAEQPLRGAYDVERITGVVIPDRTDYIDAFPSRRLRVTIYYTRDKGQARVWQTWITKGEAQADRPYFLSRTKISNIDAALVSRSADGEFPRFPQIERIDRY
jgi:hypothetical protein